VLQGFPIPLNDDGPGGLWERTLLGMPAGAPLAFSQLSGVLDSAGRAAIALQVTADPLGHPWFAVPRHHWVVVVERSGRPGDPERERADAVVRLLIAGST
jgi:hypothetical protein